jgi:FkbM family methyltransferase
MKHHIKNFIGKLRYTISKTKPLPIGRDLASDIHKLYPNLPIKTIFDIGANIGQTSRYFSHRFPKARILAFEPIQSTFTELQRNTAHLKRVSCFNYALGSTEGTCKVYLKPDSQWNSLLEEVNAPSSASEVVTVKTLDQFCDENNIEEIDFLKTDTEGFDLQVIQGSNRYLSEGKIKFVLAEVGFLEADKSHTFFPEIYAYMVKKGFRFFALYDLAHYSYSDGSFGLVYCNALFVQSNVINGTPAWQTHSGFQVLDNL